MASAIYRLSNLAFIHLKQNKFLYIHAPVLSQLIATAKSRNKTTFPKKVDIQNISKLEDLLNCSVEGISPLDAVNMLTVLSKWIGEGKIKSEEFINDSRFVIIYEIFSLNSYHLSSSMAVVGLKSLLEIGINSDSNNFKFVEDMILDRAPHINLKPLIMYVHSYCQLKMNDSQRQSVNQICVQIQSRQDEITDIADAIKLLECKGKLERSFLAVVEKCTFCLIDRATIVELQRLLCILANVNLRSALLIPAICSKMIKVPDKLNVKQIVSTLYAMNTLTVLDSALLEKLSSDLIPEIPLIQKVSVISSILTCVGQLRWCHPEILESCGEWITCNFDSCRPRDFATYILTLANLNYIPEKNKEIISSLLPKLNREDVANDSVWLDVVWSLGVLKLASKDVLATVLQPQFYEQLIGNDYFKNITTKRKLQNLRAVMQVQFNTSVSPNFILPNVEVMNASENVKQFKLSTLEALNSLVPQGKFMMSNISTKAGILIDAEFIIDNKGKPVQLEKYGINAVDNQTKPLPDGFQRMVLLIWDFKDFTLNSQSLIGANELSKRILIELGYTILEVSYDELKKPETTLQRVQFLQKKIMEKIKKTE